MDATEQLFWSLMRRFEMLAVDRYQATAVALLTDKKLALVRELARAASGDAALGASDLREPIDALLSAARGTSEAATLLIQGLLLEPLGRAIYRGVSSSAALGEAGRALASLGESASDEVCALAPALVGQRVGKGEPLYAEFAEATQGVLQQLDRIGEVLDRHFADKLQLRFADLVGEVASELLPTCAALGMNRRKVVCHLTNALMSAA